MRPFDIDRVSISVSKHFRNTWMRKWDWDHLDLREALRQSYRTKKTGKAKWEIFVRKKGEKKLVVVYDKQIEEVSVFTGTEG